MNSTSENVDSLMISLTCCFYQSVRRQKDFNAIFYNDHVVDYHKHTFMETLYENSINISAYKSIFLTKPYVNQRRQVFLLQVRSPKAAYCNQISRDSGT